MRCCIRWQSRLARIDPISSSHRLSSLILAVKLHVNVSERRLCHSTHSTHTSRSGSASHISLRFGRHKYEKFSHHRYNTQRRYKGSKAVVVDGKESGARELAESAKRGEYLGEPQDVKDEWIVCDIKQEALTRPWLRYMANEAVESPTKRLSREISAFEAYIRPNRREAISVDKIVKALRGVVGPKKVVTLIGSRRRGLATSLSDIDVRVSDSMKTQTAAISDSSRKDSNIILLRRLLGPLERSQHFECVEIVFSALPIIRALQPDTGLRVQLQGSSDKSTQDSLIATYLTAYPHLRSVYLVLRHVLEIRKLNIVFEGGVGSYSLLVMIITAFNHADPDQLKTSGDCLLHVLRFWAEADCYNNGYVCSPAMTFDKKAPDPTAEITMLSKTQKVCLKSVKRYDEKQPFRLFLQDPADYTNDLGRKAGKIKHVQKTFESLSHRLRESLNREAVSNPQTEKGSALLAPLVEANYTGFEQLRKRLHDSATAQLGSRKGIFK